MKHNIYIVFLSIFLSAHGQSISFFPDTIFACKTDSVKLTIPSELIPKTAAIQWITPYSIIYHTTHIAATATGRYILKIKLKNGEIGDTVVVVKNDFPIVTLHDTLMCVGKPLTLYFNNIGYKYYYPGNTKKPLQEIKITEPGKYTVKVDNNGCALTKSFNVAAVNPTSPEKTEYEFCLNDENKKIQLKHNGISTIYWSNGSTQKTIYPDKEGIYWVKITDMYCGTHIDTIHVKLKACNCEIFIPNTFSPNEDGKNDYFYPILSCDYSYYNFTVYDRWNNVVFNSNTINAKWDGRYKGNLLPEDIYIYKIETIEKNSDKKNIRSGKIALIR